MCSAPGCRCVCQCVRDNHRFCTLSRPWCGHPVCQNVIFKPRDYGSSTIVRNTPTACAATFIAAAPPPRSFVVNAHRICEVLGCGHTCFEENTICGRESCKVAKSLLLNGETMEVTDGVCWSCKHKGCTDERHKRMGEMLRNRGRIVLVRAAHHDDLCPGYFIKAPAPGFSGPTFFTPGIGPTSSALGSAAPRVHVAGVGNLMIARNPLAAPVREIERFVIHDPLQAIAFAHARGQDPSRVLLRMQQRGTYFF